MVEIRKLDFCDGYVLGVLEQRSFFARACKEDVHVGLNRLAHVKLISEYIGGPTSSDRIRVARRSQRSTISRIAFYTFSGSIHYLTDCLLPRL